MLLLQQFLLVPLFLVAWGPDYYGSWLVISAIPSMLMLSNMSLGTAASVRVALELGEGKDMEAGKILATSELLILSVCGLLVAVTAMLPGAFFEWVSVGQIQHPNLVLSALLAGFGIMALTGPLEGLWNAKEKAAASLLYRAALEAACLIAAVLALLLKFEALGFAVTILLVRLVGTAVFLVASWRVLDPATSPTPSLSLVLPLLRKGVGFQVGAAWPALYFQGSILLANWILGPIGAAAWGTLRTLTRFGNQAPMLLFQALYPEMQLSLGKGDVQSARHVSSTALVLSALVGAVLAGGLLVAGSPVYSLWTQDKFDIPQVVWPLMAVGLFLNCIWYTSQMVPFASNRPWELSLLLLGGAMLSIVAMAIATLYKQNLVGMAAGAIVFELVCVLGVTRLSLALLNDSFGDAVTRGWRSARPSKWRSLLSA